MLFLHPVAYLPKKYEKETEKNRAVGCEPEVSLIDDGSIHCPLSTFPLSTGDENVIIMLLIMC